jgi:hypothetical protein
LQEPSDKSDQLPKGLVVVMHPFTVAGAFQEVQLARFAGKLIEALSLLGRIEIVRCSVGKEERARSDPPN